MHRANLSSCPRIISGSSKRGGVRLLVPCGGVPPWGALRQMPTVQQDAEISYPMPGAVVCGNGAHTVHLFAGNLLEEALVLMTSVLSTPFRSTSALFGNRLFYPYHSGRTIRSIALEQTLLVEQTVLPLPF